MKDVQEFLDESSRAEMMAILECERTYETFYRPLTLTIRDANGAEHRHTAVVSLNFVAGNPANYQIILIPESMTSAERTEVATRISDTETVHQMLFEFVATRHDREIDWESVAGILLELPSVRQVVLYDIDNDRLNLLATANRRPHSGTGIDPERYDVDMVSSIRSGQVYAVEYPPDQRDHEFGAELAYPLSAGDRVWGCWRVIHCNEHETLRDEAQHIAAFIGTALSPYPERNDTDSAAPDCSALLRKNLADIDVRMDALAHLAAYLRKDSAALSDEVKARIAETVKYAFDAQTALIGATMTMTSVDEVRITEQVDLNRILRDVYGILEAEFPQKTISLDSISLPVLAGDEDKLRKALYYMLYCLLALHDDSETVHLRLGAEVTDDFCRLDIHSPSVGLDGVRPERLFADEKQRHEDTTAWHYRMMMSAARTIARRMHGDVVCNAEESGGITLTLSFAVGNGGERS